VYQVGWRCKLLSDVVGRIRDPTPTLNPNYTMRKDTHVYSTSVEVANLTGQNLLPTPENSFYRVQQDIIFPIVIAQGQAISSDTNWRISHNSLSNQKNGPRGSSLWLPGTIVYVIAETRFPIPGGHNILQVGTRLIITSEPCTATGGRVSVNTTRPERAWYRVEHAIDEHRKYLCISPRASVPHMQSVYDP